MTISKIKGKVYLVGAGPGEPGLITVRGAELLKLADCVICDKLANPLLLNYVRPTAEIINAPKRTGKSSVTQEEINKLLIEKSSKRQIVVRLKGGDPCIFGRGGEEAAILAQAGIDFEIVPGITAGIAAAEYAGIMLTDRNYSSEVIFVTGREADGKKNSGIDWQLFAKFSGTIVFYMAMGSLKFIVGELIKNGMAGDMPAAVIADATLSGQKILLTSLKKICEECIKKKVKPPAIIIVGKAAKGNSKLNWFTKKPLFGKNIVVTRDQKGNAEFAAKIIQRGGNAIELATIKIKPSTQTNRFLKIPAELAEFDWVIFTSANGVSIFFDALRKLGKDGRIFGSAKIAAIGSETAAKLSEFGIRADFVPSVFTSEDLGKELTKYTNLKENKVLLLRSELASDELNKLLTQAGAEVQSAALYEIVTQKNKCGRLKERISEGIIDWLTFASPSSVKGFFEQISSDIKKASNVKIASIGPITSQELKKFGIKVDVEANEHTIDGLLAAIEGAYK
ncbi:MAG: uroporphyrinogen-III C-methyltransferase [Planctomycetota bacterium]|nr:uroporphyrinogen-III C-methyltransferase [Planctomycetota bacterium]